PDDAIITTQSHTIVFRVIGVLVKSAPPSPRSQQPICLLPSSTAGCPASSATSLLLHRAQARRESRSS
ncbi:hypothetical protein U9M48_008311, partial [Paspalum notatum var. saurae]